MNISTPIIGRTVRMRTLTAILTVSFLASAGATNLQLISGVNGGTAVDGGMPYLLHKPAEYDANPSKTYPTMIYLHGDGERCLATDYGTTAKLYKLEDAASTPPGLIKNGNPMTFTVGGQTQHLIVISPQIKEGKQWGAADVIGILDDAIAKGYRIDQSRVYLTGFSFGGEGTWDTLSQVENTPNRFAAAAPVHARTQNKNDVRLIAPKNVALWGFQSVYDDSVQTPWEMLDAMRNLRDAHPVAEVRFTMFDDNSNYKHSCTREYKTDHSIFPTQNLYEWFLTKSLQPSGTPVFNNVARATGVVAATGDINSNVTKLRDGYLTSASVWKSVSSDMSIKWATYDLGTARNVGELLVFHARNVPSTLTGMRTTNYVTKGYTLEGKLNLADPWTQLATVTNNWEMVNKHSITPTSLRYIRLAIQTPNRVTAVPNESGIWELEVMEASASVVANPDNATTDENTLVDISVLANDTPTTGLSIQSVTTPGNGSVAIVGSQIRYTPGVTFSGTDTFSYTATNGSATASALVTVTVNNVNPTAAPDSATTQEATAVNISVLANDSGPSTLAIQSVGTTPNGTTAIAGSQVTYTPAPGFYGDDNFSYTAVDLSGGTAVGVVTVTVPNSANYPNLLSGGLTGSNVGSNSAGSSRAWTGGDWEVNGSGTGLTASVDSFHYESASMTGDFQLVARVKSLASAGLTPRAGLMLRDGAAADARMVYLSTTTSTTYRYGSRSAAAGPVAEVTPSQSYTSPNAWLMLERVGDVITMSVSADGQSYTAVGSVTLAGLPATVTAGLFSSSGTQGMNARALVAEYESTLLATPTSLWKLDESTGTVVSDSRGIQAGSWIGNLQWVPAGGTRAGALQFLDGTNDFVQVADNAAYSGTAVSVALWFQQNFTPSTSARGLISKRANATGVKSYSLFLKGTTNTLWVDIGGESYDTGYSIPATTAWFHVAMVFDGALSANRLKLYVDGALVYSVQTTINNVPDTYALTCIGSLNYNYGPSFMGLIDDVRFYNSALTPENVLQLAQ